MVDFYLQAIYTLTGILSYISLSTASGTLESSNSHADLIQHLDTVNNQLHALSRSIRSAHSDFTRQQEDVCRYFAPMSDTICGLQSADNSLARSEALNQAIHGKYSPGKRSDDEFTELSKKRLLLDDILQKQTLLDKLQRIVDAAQSTVQNERETDEHNLLVMLTFKSHHHKKIDTSQANLMASSHKNIYVLEGDCGDRGKRLKVSDCYP